MESFAKPRKVPPQNIVIRLSQRETFGCNKPGTHFHTARKFYQNVFPNYTLINVEKPPCFVRKFSPDGKYLIAYSSDQTSVEIYMYRGAGAAGDLLQNTQTHANEKQNFEIKNKIFERFFKLKYVVNICPSTEQLNRECSLFTEDSRYVIVGSATFFPEPVRPHFYEIYTNNESVTPNPRFPLEDFSIHLIDLQMGKLCDTRLFQVDKIHMSHNQGLYLYKDMLAVLSVQHQTVHIFQILDGMFIDFREIGRFCFEDDAYFFHSVFPSERPFREKYINSLKHRILAFLYKRALRISTQTNNPYEIRKFYQYFENFQCLRIWKMQLLDESHLLLKYASEDMVTLKITDPNSEPSFFVIYNIIESKVLAIYENISREFLDLYEQCCDSFRNASIHNDVKFTCSPSNNIYARLILQRFKQTIISAKFGGKIEATKRLLAQIPISAQSYSSSPYLDLSLFSYDDKWVSVLERPKPFGEHPIRFYARDSGFLKFRIYAGKTPRSMPSARKLVAYIFHPTDPFAMSVQRTNAEYMVNIHVRFDNPDGSPTDDNNVINFGP